MNTLSELLRQLYPNQSQDRILSSSEIVSLLSNEAPRQKSLRLWRFAGLSITLVSLLAILSLSNKKGVEASRTSQLNYSNTHPTNVLTHRAASDSGSDAIAPSKQNLIYRKELSIGDSGISLNNNILETQIISRLDTFADKENLTSNALPKPFPLPSYEIDSSQLSQLGLSLYNGGVTYYSKPRNTINVDSLSFFQNLLLNLSGYNSSDSVVYFRTTISTDGVMVESAYEHPTPTIAPLIATLFHNNLPIGFAWTKTERELGLRIKDHLISSDSESDLFANSPIIPILIKIPNSTSQVVLWYAESMDLLKIIDKDNGTNHGIVSKASPSAPQPSLLLKASLYPNPASHEVKVQFIQKDLSDVRFRVFDILGSEYDIKTASLKAGSFQINVSSLPRGVYFLLIEAKGMSAYQLQLVIDR